MFRPASGWASIVLVGLMLLTVAWSIQAADYAPGLEILTPIVIGGVVVGALLGTQRWLPASLAHGWSLMLGLLFTAYLGTHLLPEYLIASELDRMGTLGRLATVRDWFVDWAAQAPGGAYSPDDPVVPFAFVLTMAFLLWLLSYICTWFVVRYLSWWGAALPSGFALVFNLYQAPDERIVGLAFFLICALLLAERTHLVVRMDEWQRAQIGYSPDISMEFMRDGVIVVLVVVGLSWLAPTGVTSQGLRRALESFAQSSSRVEQRFNQLFPNLNYPIRGGGSAFGSTMPLGGSVSLGGQAIFDANVAGSPVDPRYFRMAVFDTYDGAGWSRSAVGTAEGDDLNLQPDILLSVPVTQTYRTYVNATQQLYTMRQPTQFSLPVRAELGAAVEPPDVVAVESLEPLGVADTYEVVSSQSIADVELLRLAGADDPDWVTERYSALPPSLPIRVHDLAIAVTDGSANRYDAASRIERFLRDTYDYSETIDDPPSDQDRVDWFLFDERRGYCDYYSSSFVVLARSVGIPARLAAGYSRGTHVPEADVYRQHESDAHTWPEVYFPQFGWLEFEPTSADSLIERSLPPEDLHDAAEDPLDVENAGDDFVPPEELEYPELDARPSSQGEPVSGQASNWWLLPLMALFGATMLGASVGAVWWHRPFRGLTAAQAHFSRLRRVGRWLGLAPNRADTPHEYAVRLTEAIPEGREDILTIVDAYVGERFGRRPSGDNAATLGRTWLRLRGILARAYGRMGLGRITRR